MRPNQAITAEFEATLRDCALGAESGGRSRRRRREDAQPVGSRARIEQYLRSGGAAADSLAGDLFGPPPPLEKLREEGTHSTSVLKVRSDGRLKTPRPACFLVLSSRQATPGRAI